MRTWLTAGRNDTRILAYYITVVPVDNYVIFYIPDTDKKLVTVIRVMYSGRDIDKQLDEFTK